MCVLGFNFVTLFWEKCDKNIHEWQIVKSIKVCNSKSYRPLVLILIYTIHQPFVHVCTKFQCYSFHSSWEIFYEKFSLMVNWRTYHVTPRVIGLCPGFLYTPYINGYVCTKLQLVTLQFLRKVPQKFIWWGWTEWCTEERNQVKNDRRKEWLKVRQIQYSPIVWKRGYNNIVFVICLLSRLIVLGFNNTSTLVGHFMSFPRERKKTDRRDIRGEKREGQGRKRNRNESEEAEE